MTGLLICVFLIMGSMAVWADQTGAVSGQTRVFDQAGLFSETEKIQLEEEIAQYPKNSNITHTGIKILKNGCSRSKRLCRRPHGGRICR